MTEPIYQPRSTGRRFTLPFTPEVRETAHRSLAATVERAELFRAATDAGRALALSASARTLLKALVGFYGQQQLAKGLIVWPSNVRLIDQTGIAERTLRNGFAALRRAGLIIAVDSANGKRYARRDRNTNAVLDAYGFDLAPLYARRAEFAAFVAQADALRDELRARRNALSAIHKDLEDLATAFAELRLSDLEAEAASAVVAARPPRSKFTTLGQLDELLVAAETARTRLEHAYYRVFQTKESTANAGKNGRHKETKPDSSIEDCHKRSGENSPRLLDRAASGGAFWASEEGKGRIVRDNEQTPEPAERFEPHRTPVAPGAALSDPYLWRRACPELENYARAATMEDTAAAGRLMSKLLRVSASGLDSCRERLGPALFPLVAVYVYQLHADDEAKPLRTIRNLGGLFMTVAREVSEGSRDLAADLMAMARKRRLH